MSVLVVGSVALDSVETPFGKAEDVLGGSATFFSASASHLTKVSVVGVIGSDYPVDKLEPLKSRGVEFTQEPTEQPYGIDAGFRDPSGNHFRMAQRS